MDRGAPRSPWGCAAAGTSPSHGASIPSAAPPKLPFSRCAGVHVPGQSGQAPPVASPWGAASCRVPTQRLNDSTTQRLCLRCLTTGRIECRRASRPTVVTRGSTCLHARPPFSCLPPLPASHPSLPPPLSCSPVQPAAHQAQPEGQLPGRHDAGAGIRAGVLRSPLRHRRRQRWVASFGSEQRSQQVAPPVQRQSLRHRPCRTRPAPLRPANSRIPVAQVTRCLGRRWTATC